MPKRTRSTHHVVPDDSGTWKVVRGGASRASIVCTKKAEAVKAARQISLNQNTELIVHGKDGRIQKADSHGNDPCPPKDKR